MTKKIVIVLLITVLAAGAAFGADKEGFIKPYFGIGGAGSAMNYDISYLGFSEKDKIMEGSGFAILTGVDYISPIGITIGLKYTMLPSFKVKFNEGDKWSKERKSSQDFLAAGLGYTFSAEKFCVGGKVLFGVMPGGIDSIDLGGGNEIPLDFGLMVGGAVDFTFWVIESLGISALFDIYFPGTKIDDIPGLTAKFNGTIVAFGVGVSLKL